jgi:signal transduction histidine kinase
VITDAGTLLQNSPELIEAHAVRCEVSPDPVWCLADEAQIRQIVWNLATNGLRAMASGGRLRLSVAADPSAGAHGEVVLGVHDEGCGIPGDELDAIFQPFRSSFEKGTGLGLAIVNKIVEEHGGDMHFSSRKEGGSRVTMRFARAPADRLAGSEAAE